MSPRERKATRLHLTHWSVDEVLVLKRWGFLPDLTPEDLLWLGVRETKKGMGKVANSIIPRDQITMFTSWLGIGTDLWHDRRWRSCLVMRYSRGDKPAISFLEPEWKLKLESAGKRLRARLRKRPVSGEELEVIVGQTIPPAYLNDAYFRLAYEYLEALMLSRWEKTHLLNLPVTESRLFERVLENSERDIPKEMRRTSTGSFLFVIGLRADHAIELVGKVCYYLYLLEHEGSMDGVDLPEGLSDVWPDRFQFGAIAQSGDHKFVAERYEAEYGIPRGVLTEIRMAFLTLSIRDSYRLRVRADQSVFWAAKILSVIDPEVFAVYKGWVDLLRNKLLHTLIAWKDGDLPSASTRYAVLNPWKSALLENPLLNCVFHGVVLDGMRRIERLNPQGRPTQHVEGVSIAVAVKRLKEFRIPKQKATPRSLLLGRQSAASDRIRASAESCDDLSVYSLAAPLVTAMLPPDTWVFGRPELHRCWREYHNHPDVVTLDKDLERQFADATWRKRRHK